MLISVVITNFNGAHLLKKNLPRIILLLEKSKQDYELIVVDDASIDESKTILNKFTVEMGSRFAVIYKEKNEGFASTVDMGIRAAKGDCVFTLKTDTVPEKSDYFQLMLEHFKNNPKLFAVSACLKTVEDGRIELRGQGQIYFQKGFFLHRRIDKPENIGGSSTHSANASLAQNSSTSMVKIYSSWADGSASVFNKAIYRRLGGFDCLFNPFYWEDTDLGYRAWKAGYIIEFEPKAILLHDFEVGSINTHYSKKKQRQISLRNQFLFTWKNADGKHLCFHCLWLAYHALVALKNGDWPFFQAYFWSKFHFFPILAKRIALKSIVKLSDDQVLR